MRGSLRLQCGKFVKFMAQSSHKGLTLFFFLKVKATSWHQDIFLIIVSGRHQATRRKSGCQILGMWIINLFQLLTLQLSWSKFLVNLYDAMKRNSMFEAHTAKDHFLES